MYGDSPILGSPGVKGQVHTDTHTKSDHSPLKRFHACINRFINAFIWQSYFPNRFTMCAFCVCQTTWLVTELRKYCIYLFSDDPYRPSPTFRRRLSHESTPPPLPDQNPCRSTLHHNVTERQGKKPLPLSHRMSCRSPCLGWPGVGLPH